MQMPMTLKILLYTCLNYTSSDSLTFFLTSECNLAMRIKILTSISHDSKVTVDVPMINTTDG